MRPSLLLAALAGLAAIFALPLRASAETQPGVVTLIEAQTRPGDFEEPEPTTPAKPLPPTSDQLRLELGAGGPGGLVSVRYSRVLSTGTRIEPGAGLAYTGILGSLLITQPLFERRSRTAHHETSFSFEVYGGYSASHLADSTRHAGAGDAFYIPDGTYHWLDLGISVQGRWRSIVLTTGLGVTKLLAGPELPGVDEEDTFWFLFPEGWLGKHGMAPALWSSIGYSF